MFYIIQEIMYKNVDYEKLEESKNELNSEEINQKLFFIKEFYIYINRKFNSATVSYKNTVKAILDQFPIKVGTSLGAMKNYIVNEKKAFEINDIVFALDTYINKFKSIRYLDFLSDENRNVVFVGPNGCGKTTLLRKLENDTSGAKIHYYLADRVLLVSNQFNPKRDYQTFMNDMENNYRYSNNIDNDYRRNMISQQFDFFLNLLERERNEEKERNEQNGTTEKIIKKWHDLVKDRELYFNHGLRVKPIGGKDYHLKYLSSGEKAILYFLIGILLQEEKDYYFIDEPENNLNPSIVSKLWNYIQRERPNSIFVYLTHDNEFVSSRINSKIYWIKKYDGNEWEWDELPENKNLPQELMVNLVGNREPVLFCESQNEYKLDTMLFKIMFPEFKIVSSGGGDKVITSVKAYEEVGLPQKAFGIIDCDYKLEQELNKLESISIYYLPFHEIENFLFSEKILKAMINLYSMVEDKNLVFEKIKIEILNIFKTSKDAWIAKNVAFDLRNNFIYRGKIKSLENINQLKKLYLEERLDDDEIEVLSGDYENLYQNIINSNEYNMILRYLDYKGILNKFDRILNFKNGIKYESEVFSFLNSKEGESLLKELRVEYLPNIINDL